MPELAELLPMVLLLVVIGGVAGVISGLLGVGGGIVLVPAFFYAFAHLGYDGPQLMQVCVATSLATIVITSIRSAHSHNKKGAVDWEMLKAWALWVMLGAVAGTWVAASVKSVTLQIVFAVLAMIAGLYLAFGRANWRLGEAMPGQPLRGVYATVLGFFSAMMGIGGGTFGVPLMSLYSLPIHRAVATASGLGLLIAVPSVIGFLLLSVAGAPPYTIGAVNIPAALLVIAMTLITTPFGVKIAHSMDAKPLKRAFAVFIILVALNMIRKVYFA
jgi:uncharacterized protein